MRCMICLECAAPRCLANRCTCWSMTPSSAPRSTNNYAKSASVMPRFTKWVLRSKTYLSSFQPSTLNNKKLRDADCHPERSEGPHRLMKAFYVFMMTNRSRVVLYTGITNSLMRRVWQHQNGEVEGFTKTYKVNRLVYYERFNHPRDAIAREKEIKGWRREKKSALVESMNPKWADLSPMLFQHTRVI